MTSNSQFVRLLTLFVSVVVIPPGLASPSPKAVPAGGWSQKMRELESTLGRLLVNISSDERFNAKSNFKTIEKDAKKLARLAHDIQAKGMVSPDADLSLRLIGSDFATEADYAAKALTAGHRAYARVVLSSMTGYCVACHTRTGTGPQFKGLEINSGLKSLSPFAKGNYYIASRSFDRAYEEFDKILASPGQTGQKFYEYDRALRAGLAVAIRVKNDPEAALKLVERALQNAKAPYYLREQATQWKKSIQEWQAEKPFSATDPEKFFAEASRLVGKARALQEYPADRSADIVYLRASAVVHELLGKNPKGEFGAKALMLAGMSYDVLDDYGIRNFSELYYRACVRELPHTELAQQCYRRYEENVYLGYTGSGGTHVPSNVRARLNELEVLATPEPGRKP